MKVNSSSNYGKYTVSLLGEHIIYATLQGSFSDSSSRDYINHITSVIKSFNNQPFAMLINNLGIEGGTPEAYQALETYNRWLNQQAIVAKAFIIDDNVTKHILLSRSPSLKQQNIAFFKTQAEAKVWLDAQLAQHQTP